MDRTVRRCRHRRTISSKEGQLFQQDTHGDMQDILSLSWACLEVCLGCGAWRVDELGKAPARWMHGPASKTLKARIRDE